MFYVESSGKIVPKSSNHSRLCQKQMYKNTLTATMSHSHSVTSNPQLEPYDSGKPHSSIAYLDAKNLYGTTLSEPLTTGNEKTGNFRFLCEHEISDFDVIIVQADDPAR